MVSTGFLAIALLMGGQFGLPLGLPPLPEDPVLEQVAPEECLWYYHWSGVAEANPKSKNQTEQLLAEPEVKQFVEMLGKALAKALRRGAPATPQGQVLGKQGPTIIRAVLTHATSVFVSHAAAGPHGPEISGGAIVGTGNQTDEVKESLEQIEKVLLGGAAPADGEADWHKLPPIPGAPPVEWGFRGKYLIVGIGAGSADSIASRMNGKPPGWLVTLKHKLPVERVSTVHYINIKTIIGLVEPLLGFEARRIPEALGLANVRMIASVSGLEGTGCVSKTWVQTEGEPSGLLTVFGPEPLGDADLAPIPKDASLAIAARIQPGRLYSAVLDGIKKANPEIAENVGGQLKQVESMLGVRFKEDLLETLGDSWCVYNSPGEGGLLFTGLTLVVPLRDHDRLVKTNDRLVELAQAATAASDVQIRTANFGQRRIFFLNPSINFMPVALAWCISDTHLIVSLSPQNIRAFLSRDAAAGTLADLPVVAEKLKSGRPVLLTYQDTAGTLKITYPLLQIFATFAAAELQQEGLEIDAALLPSLASIIRHVEAGTGALRREKDGLVYVSRQSLPLGAMLPGLTALTGFSMLSVFDVQAQGVQHLEVTVPAPATQR
ncbi:MAG TPA: hypothetical protein VGY55_10755 [Pirellulales bacterium]|jgi:hypothetical protein|nr:hypothetical protein [Pirellulales bacterium]